MRFGFFDQLPCDDTQSEQQRFQDILAQIELGDRIGFDAVWLGELHFGRRSSISASPLMILAAAAQRTKRIRLGTAVTLLPLHNPIKIAEEAATGRRAERRTPGIRRGQRHRADPLPGL